MAQGSSSRGGESEHWKIGGPEPQLQIGDDSRGEPTRESRGAVESGPEIASKMRSRISEREAEDVPRQAGELGDVPLLERRREGFMLWAPGLELPAPRLVIGTLRPGAPPEVEVRSLPLEKAGPPALWGIKATKCELEEGQVYHYWFEVTDTAPGHEGVRVLRTDPLATTVDWRVLGAPPEGATDPTPQPAAVALFRGGALVPCDPDGTELRSVEPVVEAPPLPSNEQLVIYELPPRWSQSDGSRLTGVGTFRDVLALVDPAARSPNFDGIRLLDRGHAHLEELGVNALELLPIADSPDDREWGYGTANYLAPDYDLGFPKGYSWPTAAADLARLVQGCHQRGIRMILDLVLGYGRRDPYASIAYPTFHYPAADPRKTPYEKANPEQRSSRRGELRQSWGGELWRYIEPTPGVYDPLTGKTAGVVPARRFHLVALQHWVERFGIDGLRLDSVETIANWDFVQEIREHARRVAGAEKPFLVVGEELSEPLDLLKQGRVDGIWHDSFNRRVRQAILGRNLDGDPTFEATVRRLVDGRVLGFSRGTQAVIYVGTHDVGNVGNERLHDFLAHNGIALREERVKLAFTCLLTSVGIPMILAGDEFADQRDLTVEYPQKEFDAVSYDRLQHARDQEAGRAPVDADHPDERWRARVFRHVAGLVALRTSHPALAGDETEFIHVDFEEGKRVLAWRRGPVSDPVVVVANFSDWRNDPGPEYVVHGWPATPPGREWYEVTRGEVVPDAWAGRWALRAWDATVWRTREIKG